MTANQIGRITTAGVITEFPIPTANSHPTGDHVGPRRRAVVCRALCQQDRPHHDRRRDHRVPGSHDRQRPRTGITLGPDGALWFPESRCDQIGRLAVLTTNTHDFNGDGKSDIAWRDNSGNLRLADERRRGKFDGLGSETSTLLVDRWTARLRRRR